MSTSNSITQIIATPLNSEVREGAIYRRCLVERFDNGNKSTQKILYFKSPYNGPEEKLRELSDCDDWARVLVMEAMGLGAELIINGAVSGRLLENLTEFQRLWRCWLGPRVVKISANDTREEDIAANSDVAGCSFSGGVDSVFSILLAQEDLSRGRVTHRASHAVFAHGFDIPADDHDSYAYRLARNKELARALNITLVQVETNIRARSPVDWGFLHGIATVAAVSQLRPDIDTCLIPASYNYQQLDPWGSHPLSDQLASSRDLRVVHHGAGFNRLQKLAYIKRVNGTLVGLLTFCNTPTPHSANCGRCEKCLRTRAALIVLGEDIPELFESNVSLSSAAKQIAERISGRSLRIAPWIELRKAAARSQRQSLREIDNEIGNILELALERSGKRMPFAGQ